jgi:hypothetical protein
MPFEMSGVRVSAFISLIVDVITGPMEYNVRG